MQAVIVCTDRFRRSHARDPKGRGYWMFQFGPEGETFTAVGTFADARKAAKAAARAAGHTIVHVLP